MSTSHLFPNQAHREFMQVTLSRYHAMQARMKKKKLPPLPFTLAELRAHWLAALGGSEDGIIVCMFCRRICSITESAADHAWPLIKGGGMGLENICFPCQPCNDAKGPLTPDQFKRLLAFLDEDPHMKKDVINRLGKAIKLAASVRHAQAMARDKQVPKPERSTQQELDDF